MAEYQSSTISWTAAPNAPKVNQSTMSGIAGNRHRHPHKILRLVATALIGFVDSWYIDARESWVTDPALQLIPAEASRIT